MIQIISFSSSNPFNLGRVVKVFPKAPRNLNIRQMRSSADGSICRG